MGTENELILAFRSRCKRYENLGYDRLETPRIILNAAEINGGRALDIGTGKGILAMELARRGCEVISVDLDKRERELAMALTEEAGLSERIKFMQADAARLEFADEYFDCAGMMDVLHHLDNPQAVMSEMVRVVKSGGRLIIADFDEEGFALLDRLHQEDGATHDRAGVTVVEASEVLTALGCRTIKTLNAGLHNITVLEKQVF